MVTDPVLYMLQISLYGLSFALELLIGPFDICSTEHLHVVKCISLFFFVRIMRSSSDFESYFPTLNHNNILIVLAFLWICLYVLFISLTQINFCLNVV